MKKISSLLALATLTVLCSCSGGESTDNAQLETEISPVIPKVPGTVARVWVADNQVVKAGDTLLTIDDADYRIAVQQAEVALATAIQNVELVSNSKAALSTNVTTASANAEAANAGIASAEAQLRMALVKRELADKNFGRYEALLKEASATQQQFDGAKAERDAADQGVKAAQAQLQSLSKQVQVARSQVVSTAANVTTSGSQVAVARLAVQQARNALDAARLQLSYCVLRAPAAGVVSKKSVQEGQVVSVGQPLMAITDNRNVWVVANFKETQVGEMKPGQVAEVEVDAYGSRTFKGRVESFSQATGARFSLLPPDNATGNFVKVTQRVPVKIVFTEPVPAETPLRAGMSVSVTVKPN